MANSKPGNEHGKFGQSFDDDVESLRSSKEKKGVGKGKTYHQLTGAEFEYLYITEGLGMSRTYFCEYLMEKDKVKPLEVAEHKKTQKVIVSALNIPITPQKKVFLINTSDYGDDISADIPKKIYESMADLEVTLRKSEIESSKNYQEQIARRQQIPGPSRIPHIRSSPNTSIYSRSSKSDDSEDLYIKRHTFDPYKAHRPTQIRPMGVGHDGKKVELSLPKRTDFKRGMTAHQIPQIVQRRTSPNITRDTATKQRLAGSTYSPGAPRRLPPASYDISLTAASKIKVQRQIRSLVQIQNAIESGSLSDNTSIGERPETPSEASGESDFVSTLGPMQRPSHPRDLPWLPPELYPPPASHELPGGRGFRKYKALIAYCRYFRVDMGDPSAQEAIDRFEVMWISINGETSHSSRQLSSHSFPRSGYF
ncbi:hypothetical protein TWF694_005310 [Orbilia ellipsospora]|uniref:Uncharacterized protein n=1 Tax=Orbilia ellipsospora TaxID=2528407 RepID=A0AAV9WSP6_9PEZI